MHHGVLLFILSLFCKKKKRKLPVCQKWNLLMVIIKRHYQCKFSFAKLMNCLNFLKQQNNFIDLPKVVDFKAPKQKEYDRIQVTGE